jgi:hypothetical protein
MTTISWLMLFKKIIALYSENHTKPLNTICGQNAELLNVKACGTYSYHWALECRVLQLSRTAWCHTRLN